MKINHKINRRSCIQYTSAGALSTLIPRNGISQNDFNRYNVLFIGVDDLRPDIGCFGYPKAQTPHIDEFAKSGVRFTNHFVQVPTCGASRFSLLTGRSPHKSGVTSNNHAFYRGGSALSHDQLETAQSMPELFRRSGYHTVCIGKISHTADGKVYEYDGEGDGRDEVPHAWGELPTPYGEWKRGWGIFFAYEGGRHREDGKGHRDLKEFIAEKDDDLPDGMLANTAVDKLDQLKKSEKPFFMGVGFFKPHLPFVATKKDWEAVKDLDIPIATHQQKPETNYWHKSGEFYKYDMPYEKTYPLDEKDQLDAKKAYYASVRYTDRQIGKVLDKLEETGLANSTVVVIWGDHGWHLGDSQLWGKHTPFERAVHSPLLMRVPDMQNKGESCDALVETLDIYPTLVDLCKPKFTQMTNKADGKSLIPLLNNTDQDIREASFSYWKDAISIRTKTHRLIGTKTGKGLVDIELYHTKSSPDPIKNLAKQKTKKVDQLIKYYKNSIAS